MLFNSAFYEDFVPIDVAFLSGVTTVQDTGYVDVSDYLKVVAIFTITAVGTTLDVDVEAATAAAGTNAVTIKSLTQLGASADLVMAAIDVDLSELSNPANGTADDGYQFLNFEITPDGSATLNVLILGLPRSRPALASAWTGGVV